MSLTPPAAPCRRQGVAGTWTGTWLGLPPLAWLLVLACCHGLLYLAIVPPWQHYDEPTHFEYARLIALGVPTPATTTDATTTRTVADSMYRFRFYKPDDHPDLDNGSLPSIGYEQKSLHPPLYYALAAGPVRWAMPFSIEVELYAARLLSVVLYLLVVVVAWHLSVLLAPSRPDLHIVFPLLVILTPAFTDMMSAVSNDVLANFCAAALLLGCVLLLRDGLRPLPLSLALLGLIAGVLTKRTAVILAVPLALALIGAVVRRRAHWLAWAGGALLAVALVFAAFEWRAPAADPAAQPVLTLRPWLLQIDQHYLRLAPERTLQSITDWNGSCHLYARLFPTVFASFWVRYGWGHVRMGAGWEQAMVALIAVAAGGLLVQAIRERRTMDLWRKRAIWLFLITIVAAWLAVIVRSHIDRQTYLPSGRYLHVVILPTLWLLISGVQGLLPRRRQPGGLVVLVAFFVLTSTWAWASTLISFYYRW